MTLLSTNTEFLLHLVTPTGTVPITFSQLRALTAKASTNEFVATNVSRSWLYDSLAKCPGEWSVHQHPATRNLPRSSPFQLYLVKRKVPAAERGVLIAQMQEGMKMIERALTGLIAELQFDDIAGAGWRAEATTFASLFGEDNPFAAKENPDA
jgi:hypothetical protein